MARVLAAVCLLHVLGAARASSLGSGLFNSGADLWQQNNGNSDKGCSGCQLDKMVKNCPLDVMFLLDMSDSIPSLSYENSRKYVANQMRTVSDAYQDTHLGLLAFSEIVHHDIPLKARTDGELQQLTQEVRQLPQERYGTKLSDTLRRARRALNSHNASTLVPGGKRGKIIVLVSDGCEDDDRAVENEAVQAVLDGIYIISVTVSNAYLDILKKISVQILEPRTDIDWQSTVACPASFLPHVEPNEECANVVLAMDGSDSVRRWEHVMRDYLAYTSMRYDAIDNAIGVVVFGTNVNQQSTDTMLPPTKDKKWLAEQIERHLAFPDSRGTGTTAAIQVSTAFLTQLEGSNAPINAIVVITDGPALNPTSARQALASAVAQGFKVIVIGVGNVLTQTELQTLAGPTSIVLQVDSYLDLYALDLSQYICREKQVQDCSSFPFCNVAGQVRNPNNNCQCQCDDSVRCTGGQTMNTNTCQCGCPQVQCPVGQFMDQTTCVCGPCQLNCPAGLTLDPTTCTCESVCTNNCGVGFNQNRDTCQCECLRTCPFGQRIKQGFCECEQVCTNTCNAGFTLNQNTCQCVCQRTGCNFGQTLNSNTCTCERVCTNTCNTRFQLNQITCQCECQRTCSAGERLNQASCTCEQVCTRTCSFPFQLNAASCQCECQRTCSAGERLNQASCTCEQVCTRTCSFPFQLNAASCQCECPRTCSAGERLNQATCTCEQVCTRTCSYPFQLNAASCQCECQRTCSAGERLNQASCTCEQVCTRTCSFPFQLNAASCQCECQRTCSAGERLNQASCTCEQVCTRTCSFPFQLNAASCQCECQRTCSAGERLNQATCTCEQVCTRTCSYPFQLNAASCQCECQRTCSAGERLNQATCTCEQVCTRTCSYPFQLNAASCQCVCQQNCPFGQILDQNTCTCGCAPTCGFNEDQDPNTCECKARSLPCTLTCQYPYAIDTSVNPCQCVCQRTCPFGQTLNQDTCSCGCTNTVQCNSGQRFDDQTCGCVNKDCTQTIQCATGTRFDEINCECVSICSQTQNCQAGTVFNPLTCNCDYQGCQPTTCSPGYEFDENACQCVVCRQKVQCQSGTYYDETRCQCVSTCNLQCYDASTVLDQSLCQCVPRCNVQCNTQQTLDTNTCTCRCTQGCSANDDQDPNTCFCTPRTLPCGLTCPFGAVLDNTVQPCRCVCQRNCAFGETLNQNTCTCEAPPCTKTCDQGEFLNQQTCDCVPDYGTEQCTAQESQCYNNQNATRDCQGRCICNCDINKFTGRYCDIPVTSALCDNCTFINGHYIASVTGRCDMFVICQPDGVGGFQPRINFCAPGTILKQEGPLLICSGLEREGSCPEEPCRFLPSGARYANSGHCAKYWECSNGTTIGEGCCPQGQGFDAAAGQCVADRNCPNNCASGFLSCSDGRASSGPPPCPYRVDPQNNKRFYHPEAADKFFPCAPTDFFNETACLCVPDLTIGCVPYYDIPFDTSTPNKSVSLYDNVQGGNGQVGYFNGNARIIMHRFGGSGFYFNYLEVALRVRLDDDVNFNLGKQMAIVSNGDCEVEESLAITIDAQNVYFKVHPAGAAQAEVVAVPYSQTSDGWLDIRFQYEKNPFGLYDLTGTVNGQTQTLTIKGRIDDRTCALQVGHGLGYDSLRGYVDDFKVWTCKPPGTGLRSVNAYNSGFQASNTYSRSSNTQNQASSPYQSGSNTQNQASSPYASGSNTQNQPSSPYRQSYSPYNQGSNTQNRGSQTYGR
ncbi:multiple epidermal growth factor-like domains protein 6 isoform X2 [Littorina saxatilis]|uniref:multiple epidermal growth factor-like domains protein 6 isoform X2 n=1 Tax=Littorina saxatilis TaxID=31220 RepID=UPI0038B52333